MIGDGTIQRRRKHLPRRRRRVFFDRRHGIRDDDHSFPVGRVLLRHRGLDVLLLGELFRVVPRSAVGELR